MGGLSDGDTGLSFGTGLNWLEGGLGGPTLDDPGSNTMATEAGVNMVTEASALMVTET